MCAHHSLPDDEVTPTTTERLHGFFAALVSASWPPLAKWRRVRQIHHQHFGSLDDQMLADLGLQKSAMRAAEYGIMPSDQVLSIDGSHDVANDLRC